MYLFYVIVPENLFFLSVYDFEQTKVDKHIFLSKRNKNLYILFIWNSKNYIPYKI